MPDPTPRPEQDDAVRRLLAEARHDQPMPPDVARRLDRVLDGLRAEDTGDIRDTGDTSDTGDTGTTADERDAVQEKVVSLDRLARRRTATRLLVAAAAVLVVGVGIGEGLGRVDPSGSQSSMDSGSAAGQSQPRDTPEAAVGGSGGSDLATEGATRPDGTALAGALPLVLTSAHFDADVRAATARAARLEPSLQDGSTLAHALAGPLPGWICSPGPSPRGYGRGVLLPATYDGTPVVLAVRPAAGDSVPVQVLSCGTAQVVRSTSVNAS